MKYINICILLIYAVFLSRCGIEELSTEASCSIPNYEDAQIAACQDYGMIDLVKSAALKQACVSYEGTYNEGESCSVTSGSIGCVKTLTHSSISLNTTTWFDGITSPELLDPSLTSSCESTKTF